ncbi:MAG: hypothetical protein WCJ30_01505 [Deltaproteobacteria bacterium]
MRRAMFGAVCLLLAASAGCGGPTPADAQLIGVWHMHTVTSTGSLDVDHDFRADGTVLTTLSLYTQCSGTAPIPTRTTRTWSVTGSHVQLTVQTPDSCGAYPILACLSETGIACTDLGTETMSFGLVAGTLTLAESAHGRENGSYTHP